MSGFFSTYSITLSSVLSVLISRTISLFPLVHSQEDFHLERAAGCVHVTAQIWFGPGCRLFPKSLSTEPQWVLPGTPSRGVSLPLSSGSPFEFWTCAEIRVSSHRHRSDVIDYYWLQPPQALLGPMTCQWPSHPLCAMSISEVRTADSRLTLAARDKQSFIASPISPFWLGKPRTRFT